MHHSLKKEEVAEPVLYAYRNDRWESLMSMQNRKDRSFLRIPATDSSQTTVHFSVSDDEGPDYNRLVDDACVASRGFFVWVFILLLSGCE